MKFEPPEMELLEIGEVLLLDSPTQDETGGNWGPLV